MIRLVSAFILSGMAGLIYESMWSRYLALLVGHSAYAQIIVLVIFLGGMALGAAAVSTRTTAIRDPLQWYIGIELLVCVLGLSFHPLFTWTTELAYGTLYPILETPGAVRLAQWMLAGSLIVGPSILLGTTFPLMSAGALRRAPARQGIQGGDGHTIGLLYFANSMGAAAGALIAGFVLVPAIGLEGTLAAAACLNALAALAAWLVQRETVPAGGPTTTWAPAPAMEAGSSTGDDEGDPPRWIPLLIVSASTAVASFLYEIGWIRMLSLVLGSATHAFELMLSAFILGLALGAFWIRRHLSGSIASLFGLGVIQLLMGACALTSIFIYPLAFNAMAAISGAIAQTPAGYGLFNVMRYGLAMGLMLPTTICAGMTLPVITKLLLRSTHGERAIGAVYAWNTVGSIVGVSLAAIWLLPILGLRRLIVVGGALDLALGFWLIHQHLRRRHRDRKRARLAMVVTGGILSLLLLQPGFDPQLLASGVFRYGQLLPRDGSTMLFYEEGRTASVTVRMTADSGFWIATNGKTDASLTNVWFRPAAAPGQRPALGSDQATQVLLPLITMAYAPAARQAAVVGHGSGMTSHLLLGNPQLRTVTTIDIEPAMVRGARRFLPANARVYEDPRSQFVFDDARAIFSASPQDYDLIISEPSNPWVSGVSGLFTEEFYARVRARLAPGGIFGQWIHLYEIDDDLLLSILAALHRHFPDYAIHQTSAGDLLVVATTASQLPTPQWTMLETPAISADLARHRPLSAATLDGTLLLLRQELIALIDSIGIPVNSDFHPLLDIGAERARFLKRGATGFSGLSATRFDVAAALGERVIPFTPAELPALSIPRIEALHLAAQLRAGTATATDRQSPEHRAYVQGTVRWARLSREMTLGAPPVDWLEWIREILQVEEQRHGGTMGIVDAAWYAQVLGFLQSADAPAEAFAAIRTLRAAVTYDWPAVIRESPPLLQAARARHHWVAPRTLLPALVIAHIRSGDLASAREAFAVLWKETGWSETDLRSQLLMSQLIVAERRQRGVETSTTSRR